MSARLRGGLVQDHLMPALARHTGGLKPGRAGADDHDLFPRRSLRDVMRHGLFAAGGGVVHAERHTALIDAIEAIVRADTGTDLVLALFQDLAHDLRVGHVRPRHADHVHLARGDRVAGGGHVLNAGGVEHRETRRRPHLARQIEKGRRGHAHDRDIIGQPGIGFDMAFGDVQKIDQPAVLQPPRDLHPVSLVIAIGRILIGHIAHAEDEVGADAVAHRFQHLQRKPHPVFEGAAVFVVQMVRHR